MTSNLAIVDNDAPRTPPANVEAEQTLNRAGRRSGGYPRVGRLAVPSKADPLVRRLFQLLNSQRTGLSEVDEKSGVNRRTISSWRYYTCPTLGNFKAALNAIGYDLVIVKKRGR